MNIGVYNLHEDKWEGRGIYIGRPSELGNPYLLYRDGDREVVVEKFKKYLWEIVQAGRQGKIAVTGITDALTADAKLALRRGEVAHPSLRSAVWQNLLSLLRRAQAGERLNLLCYCKPEACHGDIIKSCLEWMDKEQV